MPRELFNRAIRAVTRRRAEPQDCRGGGRPRAHRLRRLVLRRRARRRPRRARARQHPAAARAAARLLPAAGAGANIGISGVAALTAATVHVRAGRINWRLFALDGAALDGRRGRWAATCLGRAARRRAARDHRRAAPLLRRRPAASPPGEDRSARRDGARARHPRRRHQRGDHRRPRRARRADPRARCGCPRCCATWARRLRGRSARTWPSACASGAAGVLGHTPEGVDWDLLAIGAAASVPGALLGATPHRAVERAPAAAGDRRRAGRSRLRHPRPGFDVTRCSLAPLAQRHLPRARRTPAATVPVPVRVRSRRRRATFRFLPLTP